MSLLDTPMAPRPDKLSDYLTAQDLVGLPPGSDTDLGLAHWPTDEYELFTSLQADEKREAVLSALQFATVSRWDAGSALRTLIAAMSWCHNDRF